MENRVGELDAKIAVVTGGGSGIGRATAFAMAREGATVIVADIDVTAAERVADQLGDEGGAAHARWVDVGDAVAVTEFVEWVCLTFGRIDVLHNNAALTAPPAGFSDLDLFSLSPDEWDLVMRTNVGSVVSGCRAAVPAMIRQGGGSIVNTASVMGLVGAASQPAYGTSKGAVVSLTRYVATLYGRFGVRCNAVAPGVIDTPALRARCPQELIDVFAASTLLPRIGTPQDVAEAVVFLASDRAAFITGQTLCVDGGYVIHVPHYAQLLDDSGPAGTQG